MRTYQIMSFCPIEANDVILIANELGDRYYHPLARHIGAIPWTCGLRVYREVKDPYPTGSIIFTNEIPFETHFHNRNTKKAL